MKGRREDIEQHSMDWQMNYIANSSSSAVRSPQRPVPLRLFPDEDSANANVQRNRVAQQVARRLFEDEDEAEESRNVGIEQPQQQRNGQRNHPVFRGGAAVVTPLRDDPSS
jgi:hypothetical protein